MRQQAAEAIKIDMIEASVERVQDQMKDLVVASHQAVEDLQDVGIFETVEVVSHPEVESHLVGIIRIVLVMIEEILIVLTEINRMIVIGDIKSNQMEGLRSHI